MKTRKKNLTFSQCNFNGLRSVSCKNLTIFQNNESEAIEEEKITPFLYFTLQTTNGEELYSSENIPYSQNPTWSNFNLKKSCIQKTVIVRLWVSQQSDYLPALEWNISDSQVFCIGEQLLGDNFQFNSNSVVIGVNNLYFVLKSCVVKTMVTDTATLLPSYDFINPLKSFSKFSLGRIISLKNKIENSKFLNEEVQKKIVQNLKNYNNFNELQLKQEKYRHKLEQLKRLLVRENILLDNQLSRKLKLQNSVRKLKEEIKLNQTEDDNITKINNEITSDLLTKVSKLNSMRAQLNLKQIKMLGELRLIFPVSEDLTPTRQKKRNENLNEVKTYKICGVVQPSLETINFNSKTELTQLAVALGFSAQLFIMFSRITQTPIRYPIVFMGSASNIYDNFKVNIDRSNLYPLHLKDTKNVTRGNFFYGLQLMRKSIAQMMFYYKIKKQSQCILDSLNLLINERINQLSQPSQYKKSEPIKIVSSKENGRLSVENSSINSIYSEIATVGSTNSTIRTSSTKSEEPASKKVHESHKSSYQSNRMELFKSSKVQTTKRSSTITTVHRSSFAEMKVPNDRHVSDPVPFYDNSAAKKKNNLLTGLESLPAKTNKNSSRNLSAKEKRAMLFGKNTGSNVKFSSSSSRRHKKNKLASSDEDLA